MFRSYNSIVYIHKYIIFYFAAKLKIFIYKKNFTQRREDIFLMIDSFAGLITFMQVSNVYINLFITHIVIRFLCTHKYEYISTLRKEIESAKWVMI